MKKSEKRGLFFNKKGQVTIFIIIAVAIVGVIFLVYQFFPQIRSTFSSEVQNPRTFIQSCLEDSLKRTVDKISVQGGELNPQLYYPYANEKVSYLCYTNKDYEICVMQTGNLEKTFENSVKSGVKDKVKECFDELKSSYKAKGYEVELKEGETSAKLLIKNVKLIMNYSLTLSKGETQKYEGFEASIDNNIYWLVSIAESILDFEIRNKGIVDTGVYIPYKNLKVEARKQIDGTSIYILTNKLTGKKFQFAVRNIVSTPYLPQF